MRQFLLLSFLCSFCFLPLTSCKTYEVTDAKKVESNQKWIENLYFSSNDDYVYKCSMDIYGNQISGLLIIKKIANDTHRVVMTSDFGNKMIDFEISENHFKLNYVLEDLNKKMVINFLKNDFQELLRQKYSVTEHYENIESEIYQSNIDKKQYYLFVDKTTGLLKELVYTKNHREKIDFSFVAKKTNFADTVNIAHKDFKIKIKLTQITEDL